jgi:hypothetical protein
MTVMLLSGIRRAAVRGCSHPSDAREMEKRL